jgi:hypothetical protein
MGSCASKVRDELPVLGANIIQKIIIEPLNAEITELESVITNKVQSPKLVANICKAIDDDK